MSKTLVLLPGFLVLEIPRIKKIFAIDLLKNNLGSDCQDKVGYQDNLFLNGLI